MRSEGDDMRRQEEVPPVRENLDEPFGPPPSEYLYRCPVCGTELLVNEAIIAVGISMAKFQNEYHAGFMPTVGCPGCDGDTMVYMETG
jgi:ribosomal protein S27E